MKSKTIIISNTEDPNYSSSRGILTLFYENDLLNLRMRLYNVAKLSRFCKIGIYHNSEVYSANILEKEGVYTSSFVGDFNIDNDFYVALIDTNNNNKVILSGGTYAGFYFNDNSVFNNSEPTKILKPENYEHNNDSTCDKCSTCKYKAFFYNANNKDSNVVETASSPTQTKEENNFSLPKQNDYSILSSLIPQFDYIFENYEQDDVLSSLIPQGRFVKITEYDEEFSIGAIYESNEIKYICYAIKRDYNIGAPEELGENYQWLPLDKEDPLSEGFYIIFQDAKDLKIVKL